MSVVSGADVELGLVGPSGPRTLRVSASKREWLHHLRPGRYTLKSQTAGCSIEASLELRAAQSLVATLACDADQQVAEPIGATFDDLHAFDTRSQAPRSAPVWSMLQDMPSVVLDRVDVGGSETAQQALLVSRGDPGTGATWTLDGIDVTDPAALGFSSVLLGGDVLTGLEVRASAVDVRVRTPGVQVGARLQDASSRLEGGLHLRGAGGALQSDNLPERLRTTPFLRTETQRILELGADAGGPLRSGRVWLWGAAARESIRQSVFTGHPDALSTTTFVTKGRLLLGSGALSVVALRNEKIDDDRDPNLNASAEARWRQSGPTTLVGLEHERPLGGVSLLTRLSYMDAGIRLEPRGGSAPDVLQDFRGILQGSSQTVDTHRPRLQAGVEAATTQRVLGHDHQLLAGVGYKRSLVTTEIAWPGTATLAFERDSVFFRAFDLTGFAQPTRAQNARSVQDTLEAYAQDTVRLGRLTLTAGARLDRVAGRDLSSAVPANPTFPDLLPAVSYAGGPTTIGWLDLLPRAGIAWDAAGDGRLTARLTYSAYAAALGTADVTFANPIGREIATLTYYWNDRNGNHRVDRGELNASYGLLATSGLDPRAPGAASSPHLIAGDLRAPRTDELTTAFDGRLGGLATGLRVSARRTRDTLWRPLRNLKRSDYSVTAGVRGALFGTPYSIGAFAPTSASRIVPGNGRVLSNREGYWQDSVTVEADVAGRLGRRLRFKAWGAFMDWREWFDDPQRAVQDPTQLDAEPMQDEGILVARSSGVLRDVFVNARWTAGGSLAAELPRALHAGLIVHARDGFPIPYFQVASTGDPTAGGKNVLVAPNLDSYRLPAVVLVDLRLARDFPVRGGRLTAAVDAFNVLNRATTLQVVRDVELPAFNRPQDIVRPRLFRLGLEYRF